MPGVEHFLDYPVLLADQVDSSASALASALGKAGFTGVERARSLSAVRDRIRQGYRNHESDVILLAVSDSLLPDPDSAEAGRLWALAEEASVALVWLGGLPMELPADAGDGGASRVIDRLLPESSGEELAQALLVRVAAQVERRRLRRRERDLESELAELRVMESRLQHMVYHDELTGLWNRRRLKEAIELSALRATNLHRPCALVLIDIDRFKLVNDLEGYDAGDRMLTEVARILKRHASASDTAARVGSDEFALLLDGCGPERACERAEAIRSELDAYRFCHGHRYYRTCASVGVAAMAGGERNPGTTELLARADQACFVAKQHGRNRVHVYSDKDPELECLRRDHGWAPLIREAVEQDRLFFCYQPIVRVLDGAITHYECLLRMRTADGEILMPGDFIPVAERTGLIHHIDMWVVDHALDFLAGLPPEQNRVSASINLSGHAFRNADLFDLISRRLEMSWVSPTRLVFEITETAAVENLEYGRDVVARLRALGCRFSLDDFGSGFSTFHYIKHFPVDYLKLDGVFIRNIARDRTDQELVRHMIAIGRSLGKETVAEFVETREAYDTVCRLGVDFVQGHFLGRAEELPVTRIELPRAARDNADREFASALLGELQAGKPGR
jgi:diguanylate cyclase (GGDEF)-like protein